MRQKRIIADRRDPVCRGPATGAHALECVYRNVRYHFCCLSCRSQFLQNPELFVGIDPSPVAPQSPPRRLMRRTRG